MPRPIKQKARKGSHSSNPTAESTITDPRFSNIHTDPRFRLPSKKHTHVQLDRRFSRMLRDEEFSKKAAVDRYGRKLRGDSGRRELGRFYRVGGEEGDEDEEVEEELRRVEREYDPAREGGFSSSSSDGEESEADEEGREEGEDVAGMEEFGFADQQGGQETGVPMGDISSRFAVVNLDWDNIRAADLMAVFSSFVPASGRILKVSVYPSEFGRERMEREEIEGPPKEIFARAEERGDGASSSDGSEEEEGGNEDEDEDEKIKKSILQEDKGEEFDSAKLRRYQLERLRYYYAVLTCSSPTVAKQIYDAVDGTEYLTTANFFDLRFIPDDVDFSEDRLRDECERIPDGYRPNDFVTDALQHSKVRLTWDADDGARKEVQRRAFAGSRAEIDENDLKAYLGSDSSEDEADEAVVVDSSTTTAIGAVGGESEKVKSKALKKEQERQRMRALLGLGDASAASSKRSKAATGGPVGDMQITFSSGLASAPSKGSVFENEPEREETTVEKYVRKEKERKARRKEKMKGARNGDTTAVDDTTSVKETEEAPPDADLGFDDPFFTAPADDHAAASAQRKAERLAKREQRAADEAASSAQRAELELLLLDDKSNDVKHFDMNEIQKAQKAAGKKKKKNRRGKEREGAAGEQDGFQMDVKDPRFSSLFESHEFAIDPTNPRFKGTEGMRALLEEGRRKRRRGGEDGVDGRGRGESKRTRVELADTDAGDGEDLRTLVEKLAARESHRQILKNLCAHKTNLSVSFGLVYIGTGIGMTLGLAILGGSSDRIMKHLADKHNDDKPKPEYQLPLLMYASPPIPAGLFLYGWTAEYQASNYASVVPKTPPPCPASVQVCADIKEQIQWAVPLLGTLLVGLGLIAAFMCVNTYLVDTFTLYAASALAANTVLRSILGAVFPLFGLKMYHTLGLGWGNSLIAFIASGLCPIPWLFFRYGERLRTHPKFQIKL